MRAQSDRCTLLNCKRLALISRPLHIPDSVFIVANEFDPYREALIVETTTIWPEEYDDWSLEDRRRIEALLHAEPQQATQLEYIRQHSGFCRQITVTSADLERHTPA
jgi:hypothetical protein